VEVFSPVYFVTLSCPSHLSFGGRDGSEHLLLGLSVVMGKLTSSLVATPGTTTSSSADEFSDA
jgi:hypothetical protein